MRRIYFLHFDWSEKFDFTAKYFALQESRNDFYFFVAKYFASSELFASWKSALSLYGQAIRVEDSCLCDKACVARLLESVCGIYYNIFSLFLAEKHYNTV